MGNKGQWEIEELFEPSFELDNIDFDRLDRQEQIRNKQANRGHCTKLVRWVKWNVSGWLFCVVAILVLCGFNWMKLDSVVLTTLLATTTVNILGLAFIVLKGLFNHSQSDN